MKKDHIISLIILLCAIAVGTVAAIDFKKMHEDETLYPSSGLTKTGHLSDYFEGIKGTTGDSKVYFYDSGVKGATVFLAGGTHPNEPAGYMASIVILENIKVDKGRVIIVPRLNRSAFTCDDPMEGFTNHFDIKTKSGVRRFRVGSRGSNPLDQWPDPLIYTHPQSGQQYSGAENRNLNRCYPGRADGEFTEQVAYAVVQLLNKEKVDIAFDLHEAAPEIPIVNVLVYHEKGEDISMGAILDLEMSDLKFSPELSPKNFHGLSHREWGDTTAAFPFLMETSNPLQGRLRGKTDIDLLVTGVSKNYATAKASGALKIAYEEPGEDLEKRIGRHISGFEAVLRSYNELFPENSVEVSGLPTFEEIREKKVGAYLK